MFWNKSEEKIQEESIEKICKISSQALLTVKACRDLGFDVSLATFDDFITEMTKKSLDGMWQRDIRYPESFFQKDCSSTNFKNNYVHAGVIIFDCVGMILKTESDAQKFNKWCEENKYTANDKPIKIIKRWV